MARAPEGFSGRRRDCSRTDGPCHSQGNTITEGCCRRRRSLWRSGGRAIASRGRLRFAFLRCFRDAGWIWAGSLLFVQLVLLCLQSLLHLLILRLGVPGWGLHFDGLRQSSSDSGLGILSGLVLRAIRGGQGIERRISVRAGFFVGSGLRASDATPRV